MSTTSEKDPIWIYDKSKMGFFDYSSLITVPRTLVQLTKNGAISIWRRISKFIAFSSDFDLRPKKRHRVEGALGRILLIIILQVTEDGSMFHFHVVSCFCQKFDLL